MARLDGTIALLTGGARGMGEGEVRRLVAEGAKVMIGDVLDAEGEALAEELGEAVAFVHLDVSDSASWAAAVKATHEAFGPVTLLVNNAGILTQAPIDTTDEADIRRIYDVNLIGPFLGIQAVVPDMKAAGKGAIINVASAAGMVPMPMIAAYASSKWGLRGLTKCAAMELGPYGIRVNAVHPGAVRTPMTAGAPEEMFEVYAVPRIGEPEDIGAAVAYLASEEASFIAGIDLVVDGGMIMGPVPQPA
ncbi:MAG: glucose 1-dehydrogenase [Actinobacteria bacterium]|jgi:3alpha(or 20beta)-hydroxysteroid dehydrogenase|nr:glucose 1-dehydrogenase [Actinomycetota bacterium]